ncbi:MAG: 5'-methylthioadenosine/S-adenosylhomocysteine nucleosidase, partial [Gammaproteobacteria bacterium]
MSAGTAGGLADVIPHQVVVAHSLIQHDYGRSLGAGRFEIYRPGELPLPSHRGKPIALSLSETQARLCRAMTQDLEYVRFGTYASGDTFVNDIDTRNRLIELGAVAVDMESAAVVQVAEHYRVPWLVAKGISDDASTTSHEAFLEGLA